MRSTPLALLTAVVMLAAAAGCTKEPEAAKDTAASAAPTNSAPAADANAKKVCSDVEGDISTFRTKVAEAEAIGPPAGHYAVGAQYSASAAAIYAHTIAANGPAVTAATDVADAMSALASKFVDAKAKPDKTELNAAIEKFKTACAAAN